MSDNRTPEQPKGNGRIVLLLIMGLGLITAVVVLLSVLSLKHDAEQPSGGAVISSQWGGSQP